MPDDLHHETYDTIIIGSGFGGAGAAHVLVHEGERVLMIERGGWVERGPHNWDPAAAMDLSPSYHTDAPYLLMDGRRRTTLGAFHCVGGPSVYYGGVALRFRERDFLPDDRIAGGTGARWPIGYDDLEPWYAQAESLLDVSGSDDDDPTSPRRSTPFPQPLPTLSAASSRIAAAARSLGFSPFRLPLAINYRGTGARTRCTACMTCDGFACAIEAKNDIATAVLPALMARGLTIAPRTAALRLIAPGDRIEAVECADLDVRRIVRYRARNFIVAAGALATPHLLLASKLDERNPAGDAIGRYLMRHCNGMVFGVFPSTPNPGREFHKQIALHDFYFGHETIADPPGPLGSLQQVGTPPATLVRANAIPPFGPLLALAVPLVTGMLAIAEDQPRPENRLRLDWSRRDALDRPQAVVEHRYTRRDLLARRALVRQAKRIMRRAGALAYHTHNIRTFSHAVGTVRMGDDPLAAPLDRDGRFRGVENLRVADGSVMPTSAAVNPSLTILANALRMAGRMPARDAARAATAVAAQR